MTTVIVEVKGLEELQHKLRPEFLDGAIGRLLNAMSQFAQRKAMEYTPVDTGNLRARWSSEVHYDARPMYAEVGNIVDYKDYVEHDTRPHWPPIAAVTPWAHRHGMIPFLVARAISRYGTKGAHMAQKALEDLKAKISDFLSDIVEDIKSEWIK